MKTRAACCGHRYLRREWRTTWLQRFVKPLGFSPWECPLCRRVRLVNDRLIVHSHNQGEPVKSAAGRLLPHLEPRL